MRLNQHSVCDNYIDGQDCEVIPSLMPVFFVSVGLSASVSDISSAMCEEIGLNLIRSPRT